MHAPPGGERRMTHDTQCLVVGAGGASRDRTGDLLVANQTLSQLSYGPLRPLSLLTHRLAADLVGLGGVEPPTSPLSGVRSNQLSYRPAGQCRVPSSGPIRSNQLNIGTGNL